MPVKLKKNAKLRLQLSYLHAEEARVTRAGLVSRSVTMRQVILYWYNSTLWCCGQHVKDGTFYFSSS